MNTKIAVLLVEDDINLGSLLCEFLSVKGFSVDQAFNGAEGFEQFSRKKFDICLIDVMMPKMNGYKICRLLKYDNKYKNIPILMVTARSQVEDQLIGEETGVDEYITKPFELDEIVKKVEGYLNKETAYREEGIGF